MKPLKTTAFAITLSCTFSISLAQLYTDEVQVVEGLGGKVGINTNQPSASLDVNGSAAFQGDLVVSGSTTTQGLAVNGTGNFSSIKVGGKLVATRGSFTVGGSSSTYYPVQFKSEAPGHSTSNELMIYRSSTHANGDWKGTFNLVVRFHPKNWGHFNDQFEKIIYQTGTGSPYNDPVGNLIDGSGSSSGRDLIVWLKGGATYEWRNTQPTGGWTLLNSNPEGVSITDSSGNTRSPTTSQASIVTNAKNRVYYPEFQVRAKSFISNTQTYADFVFKDGYKLRPLSEVDEYIKENKHLPEIPTEAEVIKNGMDLAAMNVKLLQKVEELTLYVIEQNKKIEIQQEEIEKLKSKIK